MSGRRTLHFVYKIGDRKATAKFYRDVLGMKVLRHEEFEEGCKASCNGPYDGKWSKTMVGYGCEDTHFVCELTYNYGIGQYKLGNDFLGLTIKSSEVLANCERNGLALTDEYGHHSIEAPGGYKFIIVDGSVPAGSDPVQKVSLGCSNLAASADYWTTICGMTVFEQNEKKMLLGYSTEQAKLELVNCDVPIDHQTAYGRIAIACPKQELPGIQRSAKESGHKILTELVSLDTPGKTTVDVVILTDPDGHEICFVGDEAFRQLSQVDVAGDGLLNESMEADRSDEWYAKHKRQKAAAS